MFGPEAQAYKRGYDAAMRQSRVRTFGALRRAVIFARGLDASAQDMTTAAAEVRRERARTIRHIIRTAINSDKA